MELGTILLLSVVQAHPYYDRCGLTLARSKQVLLIYNAVLIKLTCGLLLRILAPDVLNCVKNRRMALRAKP